MHSAGEQEILRSEACTSNPFGQRFARLPGDLELYGALGLLLHDDRSGGNALAVRYIAYTQLDQVARSQFAVDGQIEQRQLPGASGDLQSNPDCPDVLEFERCFLTD